MLHSLPVVQCTSTPSTASCALKFVSRMTDGCKVLMTPLLGNCVTPSAATCAMFEITCERKPVASATNERYAERLAGASDGSVHTSGFGALVGVTLALPEMWVVPNGGTSVMTTFVALRLPGWW